MSSTSPASLTDYQKRVYTLLLQIPPGRLTTYAHLSTFLSSSPRAVGNALRSNPYAPRVPCHRVIASDGHVGTAFKGVATREAVEEKRRLLEEEGVRFDTTGRLREFRRLWTEFRTVEVEELEEFLSRGGM